MRYTAEQAIEEIVRRSGDIRRKGERIRIRLLSLAASLCCFLLVAAVVLFSGAGATEGRILPYGAFLLSPETGGYILVAVIAFLAGIILAMLTQKWRRK